MNAPRDAAAALLEQALATPLHEREAFLERATDDEALRQQVWHRLHAHEALSDEMHALLDPYAQHAARASTPEAGAHDPHGLVGQRVGPYAVASVLGGGGMGIVYRAEDTRLRRPVVLKFLPPVLTRDAQASARFAAEAQAASALDHPHICTVYEIGQTEDGRLFIAMAYYAGETLAARLARGPLPLGEALECACQLADALACAHRAGIVHRDVKPANVMLTPEGRAKLLDFGLAKVSDLHLTQTGTTLGTAAYMSPEQTRGEKVDARADLWALGVVLFEMLTGERPFAGAYEQATVYNILHEPPPPLTSRAPDAPPGVAAVVARCLQKDRDARYPDADALLADLQAARQEAGAGASPAAAFRPRPRLPARRALLAGGLLAVVALAAFLVRPAPSPASGRLQVAVLPFDAVGGAPADRAFIDGMVYTISSTLVVMEQMVDRIAVVPAADVLQAGLTRPAEAARAFEARYVVGGSMTRVADRVRFTLELFDAEQGQTVESGRLDGQRANLLALQDSVALYLARLLGVQLDAAAQARLRAGGTRSSRAFDAYTQARGHLLRYEQRAHVDDALRLFEQAVALDPDYALAYAGLGEACWRLFEHTGDARWTERAAEAGQRAVALAPDLSSVRTTLGIVYKGTGRYEDAERELQEALRLDPENAFAHQHLAATYYYLGQLEAAERAYRTAIALKPDYWAFYNNLGFLYNAQGRHEDALAPYRRVTELRPDNPWGFNNLGVQHELLGQFGEAERLYRRALEVGDGAAATQAQRNLGSLAYRRRAFAEAAQAYEAAQRLDSTDAEGWSNLGHAYHWAGRAARAQAAWAHAIRLDVRALEVNPLDEEALGRLAVTYAVTHQPVRARSAAQRLGALPRLDPDTYLNLVLMHEVLGARATALDTLGRGLDAGLTRARLDASVWLDALRHDPRYAELLRRHGPR